MKKFLTILGSLLLFWFCWFILFGCLLFLYNLVFRFPTVFIEEHIFKLILLVITLLSIFLCILWIKKVFKNYKTTKQLIPIKGAYLTILILIIFSALSLMLYISFKPIWIVDENNNPLEFKKLTINYTPLCVESPCGVSGFKIYDGNTLWGGMAIIPSMYRNGITGRYCHDISEYYFVMDDYSLTDNEYCKQTKTDIVQMYKSSEE